MILSYLFVKIKIFFKESILNWKVVSILEFKRLNSNQIIYILKQIYLYFLKKILTRYSL